MCTPSPTPAIRPYGINYGTQGNNLPTAAAVVDKYKLIGIQKMRIFEPLHDVLDALRGSTIELSIGMRNEDLTPISSDPAAATHWIQANIVPYQTDVNFKYISIGNEVVPAAGATVAGAMTNIYNSLQEAGLTNIKVTTVVSLAALGVSFPPSKGAFTPAATPVMQSVSQFLVEKQQPLMINVYPYFAYAANAANAAKIDLGYALGDLTASVKVQDGCLQYCRLVDAMVDAFYSAMEKIGGQNVELIISEIGWPSAGNGNFTTPDLALKANSNIIKNLTSGTPKKPDKSLETFFFALFNENLKPAGVEQNFGFFHPDFTPVYPIDFGSN